ncbi:MAG: hypothetical protein NZ789_01760, partial [Pseudomonadales bacterium]|nr:hypothetical protein [Pseudomonadales bacterium]
GELNLPLADGTIISAGDDVNGAYITISGLPSNTKCISAEDEPLPPVGVDDWEYDDLTANQRKICSTDQNGDKFPGLPRNNWDYIDNITDFEFTILGDPSIEGLSNNTDYFVVKIDNDTFQLSDTAFGDAIDFTDKGWGQQIFTYTVPITVSHADVDTSLDSLTYTNHGFSDGNAVVYTQGSESIGGLVSGEKYYIVNSTSDTFELSKTPAGITTINLTDSGADDHQFARSITVIDLVDGIDEINLGSDTVTSVGHGLSDGDKVSYHHPDAPTFIVSTPADPEGAPYGDDPIRGVSQDGFTIHFTESWDKYDIDPIDLGRQNDSGNYIDQFFYQDRNANLDVEESDQVDALHIHNQDSLATSEATLTRTLFSGLGMGADTTIEGRKFSGGITYDNMETVNLNLGTGTDTLWVESTHAGVTHIDAGQGYTNTINVLSTHGHTTIASGGAADEIPVGTLEPNSSHDNDASIDRIGGLLVVTGNGADDTLDIQDTLENNASVNTGTLTSTDLTGLDMPQLAEVQRMTVKSTGGNFVLTSSAMSGGKVVLPFNSNPTDFEADAAIIATALNAAYGKTDDILVQRFGDTFFITF